MTDEREPTCPAGIHTMTREWVCEPCEQARHEERMSMIRELASKARALATARRVPSAPDAGPEPSDGPLTTEHQKLMDYAVARGWPISPEGVFGLCAHYDQLRRENPVRAARPAPSEVAMAERAAITDAIALLEECAIYFDDRADTIDGTDGQPCPNREMAFRHECDRVRAALAALKPRDAAAREGGEK